MKQFNFEFSDAKDVMAALSEVNAYTAENAYSSILFHMYSMLFDDNQIKEVQGEILELFPDAKIMGTSSNGDICDGNLLILPLICSNVSRGRKVMWEAR